MSGLKEIVDKMKAIFETYAGQQGSKDSLSKKELRALLSKEILGEVTTMSGLHEIMMDLMTLFQKFSEREDPKDTLSKRELRELLAKEGTGDFSAEEVFQALDENKDGAVDFKEFVSFVTSYFIMVALK
ncbi:hypothetical protein INR49_011584 [Caranx melampygus]|nr:hypothetical protein INR49_011584 [Caranx melampygus]